MPRDEILRGFPCPATSKPCSRRSWPIRPTTRPGSFTPTAFKRTETPRAADFIRLQIEADRLHPDSSARATLEERAEALFAEHWIEWWSEVCAAVGLPKPVPKPRGQVGRLLRSVPLLNPPGHPYKRGRFFVTLGTLYLGRRMAGWMGTTFHRGFPDTVLVSLPHTDPNREFLPRWPAVAPLKDLHTSAAYTETWIGGPHLAGMKSLTLEDFETVALKGALGSPHLSRLEALTLHLSEYGDINNSHFADELANALAFPRIRQLKRLSTPVWNDREAEVVARAENLVGLEALEVHLHSMMQVAEMLQDNDDIAGAGRRLAMMARSHHLAGLRVEDHRRFRRGRPRSRHFQADVAGIAETRTPATATPQRSRSSEWSRRFAGTGGVASLRSHL